jgi:hypothetical protein
MGPGHPRQGVLPGSVLERGFGQHHGCLTGCEQPVGVFELGRGKDADAGGVRKIGIMWATLTTSE